MTENEYPGKVICPPVGAGMNREARNLRQQARRRRRKI